MSENQYSIFAHISMRQTLYFKKKQELKVPIKNCSECTSEHRQEGFQSVKTLVCADLQRRIHDNLSKKRWITSSFHMTTNNLSR